MKKWRTQVIAIVSAFFVVFNLFASAVPVIYAEDTVKKESVINELDNIVSDVEQGNIGSGTVVDEEDTNVEKVPQVEKENVAEEEIFNEEQPKVEVEQEKPIAQEGEKEESEKKDEIVKPIAEDGKVYVKIRYNRPDGDYEGWNFWVWEAGKDGKRIDFIGEDEQGKFAVVETTPEAKELGVILRKSVQGNDWQDNFFGVDKFIDVTKGDTEVVINHSDKTLKTQEMNRDFDKVTVNMHYYRFDDKYNDGWNLWSWIEGVDSKSSTFDKEDSYGKIATATYENVKNTDQIGLIIRKSEPGNDWAGKDTDKDRFVNLAYANNNGDIHVYFVQNNEGIYYAEKEVVRNPAILSAKMDTPNDVRFNVNVKLSKDKKVALKEGDKEIASTVTISEDGYNGTIKTTENLSLTKVYTVEIEGYKRVIVTPGSIYGSKEFADAFHYNGDLGALYSKKDTKFVLWAPMAQDVKLAIYEIGNGGTATEVPMKKGEKGTWSVTQTGDLHGKYYVYLVNNTGKYEEVTDPYAKAVGVNGNRGMVVDLDKTNPQGWNKDKKPAMKNQTEQVIYEMHIRDFSIDESSGVTMKYKGKYKGVTEEGTKIPGTDVATGIDHLKELGVTTVHLLPTFDHRSIDETKLDKPQYNWGYDPQNYNTPEGSYSSNPYDGEIRMTEFKEMVMNLHKAGIRVVMDVVYNHTGATADSHLNLAVPDYYYRQNADGGFSNGSGCGNEIASERSMVRKMMIDSLVYWAEEYHIDGFRFDLMGLHDIETMKQIRTALDKVDKTILMYGEGWDAGGSALDPNLAALKANTLKFGDMQIAAFSDDARDGIKGHVFQDKRPGFVNGENGLEELVKFGVVASTKHDEVTYGEIKTNDYQGYGKAPWANQPYQTVNYVSAHDNFTLFDKLQTTNPDASKEELVTMNKLAAGIVLTSQGIPFLHAGDEMARSKVNEDGSFNHNSYNAPDSVNKIDWNRKVEYSDLFNYYKGLISLRKDHKAFTMNSTAAIQSNLDFLGKGESFDAENVVAYTLNGKAAGDKWDNIAVVYNANKEEVEVTLPSNDWVVVVNGEKAGKEKLAEVKGNKATVPAQATYVLVDKESFNQGNNENTEKPDGDNNGSDNKPSIPGTDNGADKGEKPSVKPEGEKNPNTGDTTPIAGLIAVLMAAAGGLFYLRKRKKA